MANINKIREGDCFVTVRHFAGKLVVPTLSSRQGRYKKKSSYEDREKTGVESEKGRRKEEGVRGRDKE